MAFLALAFPKVYFIYFRDCWEIDRFLGRWHWTNRRFDVFHPLFNRINKGDISAIGKYIIPPDVVIYLCDRQPFSNMLGSFLFHWNQVEYQLPLGAFGVGCHQFWR
jgi:hypothetical protein